MRTPFVGQLADRRRFVRAENYQTGMGVLELCVGCGGLHADEPPVMRPLVGVLGKVPKCVRANVLRCWVRFGVAGRAVQRMSAEAVSMNFSIPC